MSFTSLVKLIKLKKTIIDLGWGRHTRTRFGPTSISLGPFQGKLIKARSLKFTLYK